jgi:EmrB/QacA subfamily drug resistance transporter
MTDSPPTAPAAAPRNGALALAMICIAQLMITLDATVMNVALPSIRDDLGFSAGGLTWVVTSYALAFGGLLLFGGRTGDLFGRRRMFMVGVALFSAASLLGGLAQSEAMLIAARVAQGVGGAIAAPTALALIATTFHGDARARAFGMYAAMAASGGAFGLLLGGMLTDLASWRWALFINVPIGLLVLLLAPRVLDESQGSHSKLDLPGALAVTAGLSSLVYGLSNAATDGWTAASTVAWLVAAVALLVLFIVIELRSAAPLMPLRIFASRDRTGAYLTMLLIAAAMFSIFFFTSQYLQIVHGWSSFETGLGFLPLPLTIMFMSVVVVRRATPRVGVRPFLLAGPVLVGCGLFVLSTLGVDSGYLHLSGGLLLMGVGLGCLVVPLTSTAVAGVAPHETGLASALLNSGQQIGGAIGLAVFGAIAARAAEDRASDLAGSASLSAAQIVSDSFVRGQSAAFTAAIASAALALVVAVTLIRVARPAPQSPRATAAGADCTEETSLVLGTHG